MKNYTFLALVFTLIFAFEKLYSQDYEFNNYEWESNIVCSSIPADLQKENSIIILDKRNIEYIYNKNNELEEYMLIHKKIKVIQDKGVEDNNKIYFPISTPDEVLTFKARVTNTGNKIIEMSKENTKVINEDGKDYMVLAVEGLEKGCDLEYFIIKKISPLYFSLFYFQDDEYRLTTELKIITPENLTFASKSYNNFPVMIDSMIGKKHLLMATASMIKPLENEKYSARNASLMRVEYKFSKNTVNGNAEIFTWAGAAKRYYEILHNNNTEEVKEIKKLLKNFDCKEEECIIKSIESYIKSNIGINETDESENVSDALMRKYTTQNGMLKIYVRFFEQAGIQFETILSSSRFTTKFDPAFETWNYLDTYLFYFPKHQKYLSPIDFTCRYGFFPVGLIGSQGLFIKEVAIGSTKSALGKIQKIGDVPMEKSYNNLDVDVKVDLNNLKAKTKVIHTYSGYMAQSVRPYYFYSNEEDRTKLAESILKSGAQDGDVTNIKIKGFDLSKGASDDEFIMEADVESNGLIEKAGDDIIVKIGELIGQQVEMYQEKERQLDMELEFTHSFNRKITITIPDGYEIKGGNDFNFVTEFKNTDEKKTGFTSKLEKNGNQITILVREFYSSLQYPLAVYPEFVKVINAAADFNKLSLVLAKKQ